MVIAPPARQIGMNCGRAVEAGGEADAATQPMPQQAFFFADRVAVPILPYGTQFSY